ncbi:hypothetical protein SBV1_860022 [Verrucomicrobia bacterium]|nr:hypothetical protein SBV1_860022 [Verrucomicrobiota bacterium]
MAEADHIYLMNANVAVKKGSAAPLTDQETYDRTQYKYTVDQSTGFGMSADEARLATGQHQNTDHVTAYIIRDWARKNGDDTFGQGFSVASGGPSAFLLEGAPSLTLAHEMGHALGLGHYDPDKPDAAHNLMALPKDSVEAKQHTHLMSDQVDAIRKASPVFAHWGSE